jgi:hypothetical protein
MKYMVVIPDFFYHLSAASQFPNSTLHVYVLSYRRNLSVALCIVPFPYTHDARGLLQIRRPLGVILPSTKVRAGF